MNPDNVYSGTFANGKYAFEDQETKKQYYMMLSAGNALLSGEDGITSILDSDNVKDSLDDESASFPNAVPSIVLLSALNNSIKAALAELASSAVMLSGGNSISGENSV